MTVRLWQRVSEHMRGGMAPQPTFDDGQAFGFNPPGMAL
jgi:hypothetical protein